jgi:ABC-type maltose transport system permease subunit
MLTLPRDLDDAAKIDGCGYLRLWSTITMTGLKT